MLMDKPDKDCGGCKRFGDQCHCLCHEEDIAHGYHEIIYHAGPFHKANFFEKIFNRLMKNNKI